MVLKLGKYMRIPGYDAVWEPALRTHELIVRANAEGRVFLTRNRRIPAQYPAPVRRLNIQSSDPVEQVHEVLRAFNLQPGDRVFSKCIRCNVFLEPVADKSDIEPFVHPNVFARRDRFFRCPRCDTVFWKGSHVTNTCRKLGFHPKKIDP